VPRSARSAKLDTRSARAKLPRRREPYWAAIAPGHALGYRAGRQGGTWIARLYVADAEPPIRYQSLGSADDTLEANGAEVLTFAQAQEKARRWFKSAGTSASRRTGPYTVGAALDDYLVDRYPTETRASRQAKSAVDVHVRPALGATQISKLTTKAIKDWLNALAASPSLGRSNRAGKRKPRKTQSADRQRSRKATANRVFSVLRAALNRAFQEGDAPDDRIWRKVKPFRDVDRASIRYLDSDERIRLINACEPEFRELARAALLTGCRYGELTRLVVSDFDPDAGTLAVQISKSGKPRHVTLTAEGRRFFEGAVAGREGDTLIFTRGGRGWRQSEQRRPLLEACKVAKIKPAIGFHILRHSHGAALAMGGAPLQVVAKQLGHSDTRVTERHYAHLAPNYVADTIRATLPDMGIAPVGNVARLAKRRAKR